MKYDGVKSHNRKRMNKKPAKLPKKTTISTMKTKFRNVVNSLVIRLNLNLISVCLTVWQFDIRQVLRPCALQAEPFITFFLHHRPILKSIYTWNSIPSSINVNWIAHNDSIVWLNFSRPQKRSRPFAINPICFDNWNQTLN